MNNLPSGTTQGMIEAQCAPIARNMEECFDCGDVCSSSDMYSWPRYGGTFRDVRLCEHCVPKCQWLHNDCGHVRLDLKPCGRIQSPNAQGPWCAEHEKEAEALDAAESEEA
jgi:hypothetical protein